MDAKALTPGHSMSADYCFFRPYMLTPALALVSIVCVFQHWFHVPFVDLNLCRSVVVQMMDG